MNIHLNILLNRIKFHKLFIEFFYIIEKWYVVMFRTTHVRTKLNCLTIKNEQIN